MARKTSFLLGISTGCVVLSGMLVGCSGPDVQDLRSGPIPDKPIELDKSELPDEPGDNASLKKKIEWNIIEKVSLYAKDFDPETTEASCPRIDESKDSKVTCTATYKGVDADWKVDISTPGLGLATYEMKPTDGKQVARKTVEDQARREAETKTVRCDMEKVQLISPKDEEKITCLWADEEGSDGKFVVEPSSVASSMDETAGFWLKSAE